SENSLRLATSGARGQSFEACRKERKDATDKFASGATGTGLHQSLLPQAGITSHSGPEDALDVSRSGTDDGYHECHRACPVGVPHAPTLERTPAAGYLLRMLWLPKILQVGFDLKRDPRAMLVTNKARQQTTSPFRIPSQGFNLGNITSKTTSHTRLSHRDPVTYSTNERHVLGASLEP
ncbi:hypothetical protein P7K49_018627, partial [Saguinus oedipus]